METIKAIFYFTNEWWRENFFSKYDLPSSMSVDELDRIYLQRKRFMYECFGEYGQGEENSVMDGKYVNMLVKWGMDIIPYILGAGLTAKEAGGYSVIPMSREEAGSLKPVDIADTDFAEWILKRKKYLQQRYGSWDHMQLLETSLNVASRLRGEEFYLDLGLDKPLARHLLGVIEETTLLAYRFFCREFVMPDVNLTNCTINHISPEMYEEFFLEHDISLAERTKELFPEKKNHVLLHNCDLPGDRYLSRYARVPYVYQFQSSHTTDVKRTLQELPGVQFCALVNPVTAIQTTPTELREMMTEKISDGIREWVYWGTDPRCDVNKLRGMLGAVQDACEANGFKAELEVIPFNFDELEWSFPKWQGNRVYSIKDADKLPVEIN